MARIYPRLAYVVAVFRHHVRQSGKRRGGGRDRWDILGEWIAFLTQLTLIAWRSYDCEPAQRNHPLETAHLFQLVGESVT